MKYTELKFAKCLKAAILIAVMIGTGALANDVQAQSSRVFEIEVPFDFVIKDQTYDAGTYRIGRLSESNPGTLVLKKAAGKKLVILSTMPLASDGPVEFSMLSFQRNGEMYILDSIRLSGESYARRIPFARPDRKLGVLAKFDEAVSIAGK